MPFLELSLATFSATVPVIFWYYILRQKKHAKKLGRFLFTFAIAGAGAALFWYLKPFIIGRLQNDMMPLIAVFLVFGVLIEYFKNFTVRLCGIGHIKNVDDIIDLSFAAALGFTFCENSIYFTEMFLGRLPESAPSPVTMTKYFLLHALFIPPIHLFCSGLFGYFYGMGLFAGDTLREEDRRSMSFRVFSLPFLFLPFKFRYKVVKVAQGTFLSVLFFGVFFAMLQRDPQISDLLALLSLPNLPVDEQLMPLIAFFFFKTGTLIFFILIDRKKRLESEGLLLPGK